MQLEELVRPIELADVLSRGNVFDTRHTMRMVDLSLGRFLVGDLPGALEAARIGLEVRQLYDYETPWRERAQWIIGMLEAGQLNELQHYVDGLEERARAVLPNL